MKKIIIVWSAILLLSSCGTEIKEEVISNNTWDEIINEVLNDIELELINEFTNTEIKLDDDRFPLLSDDEIKWLLQMREEEKLARDTYTYFYEKYGQNVFGNIDDSEEKHKSAVLPLLEQFWIEDPIKDDTPWIFTSEEITQLYNDLTTAWDVSMIEALKIWMTIEDLDIMDLNELLSMTKNPDIIRVYTNLLKWSYNHLKSFKKNLDKQGWEYTPQFISQEEYDKILWN